VPRSRELIQSCLPLHANACGVTAGEGNLFRSLIFGNFKFSPNNIGRLSSFSTWKTRSLPALARFLILPF